MVSISLPLAFTADVFGRDPRRVYVAALAEVAAAAPSNPDALGAAVNKNRKATIRHGSAPEADSKN